MTKNISGPAPYLILAVLSPFIISPNLFHMYTVPKEGFIRLAIALLLVIWAFRGLASKRLDIYLSPLGLPVLLYLLAVLISIFQAANPYTALYEVSRQVSYIALFLIVINNITDNKDITRIMGACVIAGFMVSMIGIFQYFGSLNFEWLHQGARPGSTFGNKNMAAQYVIMIIPLSVSLFLRAADERVRLFWAVALIEMAAFVVYAHSRGAWVGLTLGGILFLLIYLKRILNNGDSPGWGLSRGRTVIVLILIAIHTLLPLVIPASSVRMEVDYSGRLTAMVDPAGGSARTRIAIWANTLEMIRDNPVYGAGINNWKVAYPPYSRSSIPDGTSSSDTHFERTHNDYLQMISEIGIIGFGFYLWFLISLLWICIKTSDLKTTPYLLWGITAMLGHALFSFPAKLPVPAMHFYLFAGLIVVCQKREALPRKGVPIAREGSGYAAAFLAVSILLLLAALLISFLDISSDYYTRKGYVLHYKGKNQDSIKAYNRSLELNPFSYRAYYGRALANSGADNFAASAKDYMAALRLYPHDINAHGGLGIAYSELGDFDQAEREFTETLSLYPEDGRAMYRLKELRLKKAGYDKVKAQHDKSAGIGPQSAQTYNYQGELYYLTGSFDDAIDSFKKAIEKDNDYAGAHNNLGVAYSRKGLYDLAVMEHNKAIRLDPSFVQAYIDAGDTFAKIRASDSAVAAYSRALRLEPESADVHFKLGEIFLTRLKDAKRALLHLQESLRLDPDQPRAEQLRKTIDILSAASDE